MGCVNSRADINDLHPNIFQVMNVDDLGNLITPGRLEITRSDIVLYQRGKQPVKWPLTCLRRYGYDSEIFSFESGRRCSTGPGIYAFKCRRADQLFNLVQTNIQVCNGSGGDDTVSRDISVTTHTVPTITRVTISPIEANCLDPLPTRTNSRAASRFPHSQQNGMGRLNSAGSSSGGPMSPQGTLGSPSPPPIIMSAAGAPMGPPPPPPPPQSISASASSIRHHPSSVYVNDQILSAFAMEMELDNNNKSLRRTIQRSQTVSSTSSSGLLSEPSSGMPLHNQEAMKLASAAATYINVDLSSESGPLSPTHCASNAGQLSRDETKEADRARHAYMNVSPGQEAANVETLVRIRPIALPQQLLSQQQPQQQQQQQQQLTPGGDRDEASRHCYANLEPAEIEGLRARFSGGASIAASGTEKSPPPPPPPLPLPAFPSPALNQPASTPPPTEPIREVNYAILDLDKTNATSLVSSSATPPEAPPANAAPSPPDSPNKPQKGYATIDFNKTAALSHSVNPNVVNDNEGSRKTRHNSTINDLAAPSRHSSSISE